jgi:hypothetical protein
MKRVIFFAVFCVVSISQALAYIPPAQFIIKNMASKRLAIHGLRITSVVSGFDSGKPNGQHFKSVTLYNPSTGVMVSRALDDSGKQLFGLEKKAESLPLSFVVLYDPHSKEIISALKKAEIAMNFEDEGSSSSPSALASPAPAPSVEENSTLRRWNGSFAWVLGLSATHKDGPQLWIEKDSFLPLRIVVGDGDIQFSKYRYSQDLPYPRTIALATRAGVAELQEDVAEFTVNPMNLASSMAASDNTSNGYTDAGNASPMRELIRKYYAGLR